MLVLTLLIYVSLFIPLLLSSAVLKNEFHHDHADGLVSLQNVESLYPDGNKKIPNGGILNII